MSKQTQIKKNLKKEDVSGSETVVEMLKGKTKWIFGNKLRKPKINYPDFASRRRIDLPTPSKSVGLLVIFIILFVLQTGVIYIVYRNPPALGANNQGDPIFLYPRIHDQFIIEGIIASIIIFISSVGYLFLYQASKYIYDRSTALKYLAVGILFIIGSFAVLQFMLAVKTNAIRTFLQDLLNIYG
ncbi:MAG: hypothetical protein GF317_18705 [Candidatus Lokiarchaeota archaeon]|nr:hypothetical protein [Candidatus Lokiarchaeota archaeon]MBD3201548.1 hypothetical protein [Candidatus Lokiarchaeota archaeon]